MVVFVARPDAARSLDLEPPLVKDPTDFLVSLARVSPALGMGSSIKLQDVLEALQSYSTEVVLPLIEPVQGPHVHVGGPGGAGKPGEAKAEQPPAHQPAVRLCGLAVFRRDRMVGTLNRAETIAWLLLTGRLRHAFVAIRDPAAPDNLVMLELTDLERRVRGGSVSRPSLEVSVKLAAATQEIESGRDYSTEGARRRLERQVEQELGRGMAALVRRAQTEFKTDIFGFGHAYIGKFLYWNDWRRYGWLRERFPKARVRVTVRVVLVRPGTTLMPIRPVSGTPAPRVEEATAGTGRRR
jgi:spore germination protein KC